MPTTLFLLPFKSHRTIRGFSNARLAGLHHSFASVTAVLAQNML
ncbi:hypothetical protein yfred0001_11860 [Yersinia frederiksenii ATCC 33641]|nr:hypothetical protein yfred0001_11860 [Yersinia frederiksenii ATCC 33641]